MTDPLRWASDGSNVVEPPEAKKNAGMKPGRPETAQYPNWFLRGVGEAANLVRPRSLLLHLPLENDLIPRMGVGTVTFGRASTGLYIDRHGIVQSAAIDEPRFEADGLLMEGVGTNRFLYSQQFDNAAWTKSNASISANAANGPDGTATADKLVENNTTNGHYIEQEPNTLPGDDVLCSASVFAKAAERTWANFLMLAKDGTTKHFYVNLATGALGTLNGITSSEIIITPCQDGWFWVRVHSFDVASGGSTPHLRVYTALADGNRNYLGDGSSGIYLWQGDWRNAPISDSPILTTSGEVTRASETYLTVTYDGNVPASFEPWMFVADVELLGHNDAVAQGVIKTWGESVPRKLHASKSGNNWPSVFMNDTGSVEAQQVPLTAYQPYRLAARFDGTELSCWLDGVKGDTDTPADPDGGVGMSLRVAEYLWGHIRHLRVYNFAPTDQEMAVL